jgi:hypothetical protein
VVARNAANKKREGHQDLHALLIRIRWKVTWLSKLLVWLLTVDQRFFYLKNLFLGLGGL